MDLRTWLETTFPPTEAEVKPPQVLEANTWKDIRLFLSSTFIDTQAERDVIVKRVIPSVNRKLAHKFIRVVPVDLRWGVLAEESKNCYAIQSTCLNQVDRCRIDLGENPWFLGIRSERYGWVQNELSKATSFDHPEKFDWIDKLRDFGKQVSITSLECIHASLPPAKRRKQPTVFYYKRQVTNYENIEQDMRWVFDFEHVLPDAVLEENVKYQYNRTPEADAYRADLTSLDSYLSSSPNVKYSTFPCTYEKGGAWYTSKNEGRKSFGVGYMSGLEEFEKMVERDLLEAIDANFQEPEIQEDMPDFELESIQHENAMRLKASTFVGRRELFTTAKEHCVLETAANTVMVLHGTPGCGKSGVLAAVAARCLNELRNKGDFFFVHGVDSCPGGGYLARMLRRLQLALRYYRRNLGETDLSAECETSPSDIMSDLIVKSAKAHPEKMFVLMFDAVNQFDESMNAWAMWWLPPEDCPKNVRVLLTTLDEENGTYQNATEMCPSAINVCVGQMAYEDREEMVSSVLAKYNKRLTTTDDPFLGNQMKDLLGKSTSPLYLTAAAEALRKFGIFEKMREYIGNLPAKDVALLFGFLLNGWIEEYGFEFTRFVSAVICLTKDGVLENELNDIIFFKEKRDGSFNCSFSRIYDSIACFLAAGGGGFLRWFHDQLRNAVRSKFLTKELEMEVHTCLVEFFTETIRSQLCGTPGEASASYYPHCLQRIVYHQIKLFQISQDTGVFEMSLRNVYFIRERVVHAQVRFLIDDYNEAIAVCTDKLAKELLGDWSSFARFCAPYINASPQWAHNMAFNAPPNSVIAGDTKKLLPPVTEGEFPWRWLNNAEEENVGEKPMKFLDERLYSSAVSSIISNICCFGGDNSAFLFEMDTGHLLHRVRVTGYIHSVDLSSTHNVFWTGSSKGVVTAWNIKSAAEEWSLKISEASHVIFMERVVSQHSDHPFAGHVICGTGRSYGATLIGEIAVVDEERKEIVKTWSTVKECLTYCYHAGCDIVASGHNGVVKLWNLQSGELVREVKGGPSHRAIRDMSAHPTQDNIIFVVKTEAAGAVKRLDLKTGKVSQVIPVAGHFICQYDQRGERIICMHKDNAAIQVHDASSGNLVNKIVAHAAVVNNLNHVADSSIIVTAARDGGMRTMIPDTPDVVDESADNPITSCAVVGSECVTITIEKDVAFHDLKTHAPRGSLKIPRGKGRRVLTYPGEKFVVVTTGQYVYVVDSASAEIVADYHIKCGEEEVFIRDAAVSPSGSKCVFVTTKHGVFVYDTSNVHQMKQCSYLEKFEDESGPKQNVDIHVDNRQVVTCGENGIWLWDINTTQIIGALRFSNSATPGPSMEPLSPGASATKIINTLKITGNQAATPKAAQFIYNPDRIVYHVRHYPSGMFDEVRIMGLDMVDVLRIQDSRLNTINPVFYIRMSGKEIVTAENDGSLKVFNVDNGELVYVFLEQRSQAFKCFVETSDNCMRAFNANGVVYEFQPSSLQPSPAVEVDGESKM